MAGEIVSEVVVLELATLAMSDPPPSKTLLYALASAAWRLPAPAALLLIRLAGRGRRPPPAEAASFTLELQPKT